MRVRRFDSSYALHAPHICVHNMLDFDMDDTNINIDAPYTCYPLRPIRLSIITIIACKEKICTFGGPNDNNLFNLRLLFPSFGKYATAGGQRPLSIAHSSDTALACMMVDVYIYHVHTLFLFQCCVGTTLPRQPRKRTS